VSADAVVMIGRFLICRDCLGDVAAEVGREMAERSNRR
jgi:hypothetical protein